MDRALEKSVWQRARGRCEYCQLSQADLDLPFTEHQSGSQVRSGHREVHPDHP